MARAKAQAHTNIALIKYWGKRDAVLNLPAVGSISITLRELFTESEVRFAAELERDELVLDGRSDPVEGERVTRFLDRARARAGLDLRARVVSANSFPTAAGLASSASGFAALALAATAAAGLSLRQEELGVLARLGSGSAPRSLFGGFVEMKRGIAADGSDAVAVPLCDESHWPLEVLVAIVSSQRKKVGSTSGMELSQATSPFYSAWVSGADADLGVARRAILARDFAALAEVAEHNALKMHAVALASRPSLLYWSAATVSVVRAVQELRAAGSAAFFTIDAGPQVKVICAPGEGAAIAKLLAQIPGVEAVRATGLGPGARLLEVER